MEKPKKNIKGNEFKIQKHCARERKGKEKVCGREEEIYCVKEKECMQERKRNNLLDRDKGIKIVHWLGRLTD
jgi:hypothetical protein